MRVTDVSLTGATLALAGAALYLAMLVVAERGRANNAAEQRQSLEARLQSLEHARGRKAQPVSLVTSALPTAPLPANAPSPSNAGGTNEARAPFFPGGPSLQDQLARLTDPAARAAALRLRQDRERELNPGLRQELQLSSDEEDQLLGLLGEQDLRNEEQNIRDTLADRRSTRDPAVLDDDIDKQLDTLLGEERLKRWDDYQATLPERRSVIDLRARLGEGDSLSEAAAKQLVETMHDERERFAADTRRFAGTSSYNDSYPERARLNSDDLAARLQFREEQIARTADYYARIRERAAAFLSAQQVQRLEDLHEGRLVALRANLARGRAVERANSPESAAPVSSH